MTQEWAWFTQVQNTIMKNRINRCHLWVKNRMNTDHGTTIGSVYTDTKHYCETSLKHVSFVSFAWCLGRAAACDCGTPWTFLLHFLNKQWNAIMTQEWARKQTMKSNHDTRLGKVHTGKMHFCEKVAKSMRYLWTKNYNDE